VFIEANSLKPTAFKTVAFVRSAIPPSWDFVVQLDRYPIAHSTISDASGRGKDTGAEPRRLEGERLYRSATRRPGVTAS
jgi:hypothetical protein